MFAEKRQVQIVVNLFTTNSNYFLLRYNLTEDVLF